MDYNRECQSQELMDEFSAVKYFPNPPHLHTQKGAETEREGERNIDTETASVNTCEVSNLALRK